MHVANLSNLCAAQQCFRGTYCTGRWLLRRAHKFTIIPLAWFSLHFSLCHHLCHVPSCMPSTCGYIALCSMAPSRVPHDQHVLECHYI